MTAITVSDKSTGDTLTAAEFQQILDALKKSTRDVNTALLQGTTLKVGDVAGGNYFEIEANGFFKLLGTARAYDDLSAALITSKLDTTSGRLDYDYFNAGVNFNDNARYPDEPVVIPIQCKHAMLIGTGAVFRPHMHWLQQQSGIPNFLLGYKKTNYGEATTFESDWSNYTFSILASHVFTYTSGTLAQISKFPEIDTSDLTISASMDFVLFRDTANASGLFSGADPVSADVTVKYNDSHVPFDGVGSNEEYVK